MSLNWKEQIALQSASDVLSKGVASSVNSYAAAQNQSRQGVQYIGSEPHGAFSTFLKGNTRCYFRYAYLQG